LKKISATSNLITLSKIPLAYGTYGIKAWGWGVKEWTERWLGLRLDRISWFLRNCKRLVPPFIIFDNFGNFLKLLFKIPNELGKVLKTESFVLI
jgi:hypothetical protein